MYPCAIFGLEQRSFIIFLDGAHHSYVFGDKKKIACLSCQNDRLPKIHFGFEHTGICMQLISKCILNYLSRDRLYLKFTTP